MGVEFEVKFRATPEVQEQLRKDISGAEEQYQMETTYYDTPTGAFSARWCTLRCRKENSRSVCTLKAPAQGHGRREWEVDCDSIAEAFEKLCKLGVPEEYLALAQEGLVPVCGAEFTRIAKTVELDTGTAELALDKGILMGGGKEIPLCEVEIERKTCSEESCVAYASFLAMRYALEQEPDSKFRRAQLLAKGE